MKKQTVAILAAAMVFTFAGCGKNSANNLGGTTKVNPDDVYGSNIYWDGYGINTGRSGYYTEDRSSYGTPRANDKSFGQDVKNAVKHNPVTDAVRDAVDGDTARNTV